MTELDPALYDLAEAFGVATEYWDWQGRHVSVDRATVIAVLAALDIDASTPEAAAAALANQHRYPWTRMLPSCMTIPAAPDRLGMDPCAAWQPGQRLDRS